MSEWQPIDVSLPPLEEVVWLALKDGGVIQGMRSDCGEDGWLWANCYSSAYMKKDGQWDATDAEADDDYQVTHWMPLPEPPR